MARTGRCLAKVKLWTRERQKSKSATWWSEVLLHLQLTPCVILKHTTVASAYMDETNRRLRSLGTHSAQSSISKWKKGKAGCASTLNYSLLCKTGFLRCVFPWETPCSKHPLTLEGGGPLCCRSTGELHLCGTTDTPQSDKDILGRRQWASL